MYSEVKFSVNANEIYIDFFCFSIGSCDKDSIMYGFFSLNVSMIFDYVS